MKSNRFFRYGEVDYKLIKKIIEDALERDWGPRCETKDYEDFPDILDSPEKNSRCPACVVYERFDSFWEYFSPDDVS